MRNARKLGMFLLVSVVGMATANGLDAQQAEAAAAQEPVEVTQELLERFVEVYPEVTEIAEGAQVAMATVQSAEEAQAIQAEAQQRIASVLEEAEVSAAEYEAVVLRLNEDEELRAEFERLMEERATPEDGR
jgi:hypothetical protein